MKLRTPRVTHIGLLAYVTSHRRYLSFCIAFLCSGAALGFSIGSTGSATPNVVDNTTTATRIVLACASGMIVSMGNLLFVFAQVYLGVTATGFIAGGLALVLGTGVNYAIDPSKSDPAMLFGGVAASFVAVIFSTLSQKYIQEDRKTQQSSLQSPAPGSIAAELVNMETAVTVEPPKEGDEVQEFHYDGTGSHKASIVPHEKQVQMSPSPTAPSAETTTGAPSTAATSSALGLMLAVVGGTFQGIFSPIFNLSVNPDRFDSTPLTTYTAFLLFCLSFFFAGMVCNIGRLWWTGRADSLSLAQIGREWAAIDLKWHVIAMGAGVFCNVANICIAMSGATLGFAAAIAIAQVRKQNNRHACTSCCFCFAFANTSLVLSCPYSQILSFRLSGVFYIGMSIATLRCELVYSVCAWSYSTYSVLHSSQHP